MNAAHGPLLAIGGPLDKQTIPADAYIRNGDFLRVMTGGGFTTYQVVQIWENATSHHFARYVGLNAGDVMRTLTRGYLELSHGDDHANISQDSVSEPDTSTQSD